MLRTGDLLKTETSGLDCVVDRPFGEGGQGAVYQVLVDGQPLALKWYFDRWLALDVGLRTRLEHQIERGSPSDRYLWPIELVTDRQGGFGYLMPIRPTSFSDLKALLKGRIKPTFYALTTAAFELAHNFHELHALGLSYQDISDGNVFMDERSGEIRVCDCDNVSVNNVPSAIGGTPGFVAPEVMVRGAIPSRDTDYYSLAVLLFQMLLLHHPLMGARELEHHALDAQAQLDLYCRNPIFIFDPKDDSNRPMPGLHDRALSWWPIYPKYIHDLFVQAFTDGLHDPSARVYDSKWRSALLRLRDSIQLCEHCTSENFYDSATCWDCGKPLEVPLRLKMGDISLVMNTTTQLYDHHIDPSRKYVCDRVVARVVEHPREPGVWGLRNQSDRAWSVTGPSGEDGTVEPGRVMQIRPGVKVGFGHRSGEIVQ